VAARSSDRIETLVVARFRRRRPGRRVELKRGRHQPDRVSRGPSRERRWARDQRSLVRHARARVQGSASHEFGVHATGAPHVHCDGVVGRVGWLVEQQLGRPVVARTSVPGVRHAVQQVFRATKVAQLKHARDRVQQQVAWFYVPVAQPRRLVHVLQAPKYLVRVQLAVARARRPAVRRQPSDRVVQVGRRHFHYQVQPTGAAVPSYTAHVKYCVHCGAVIEETEIFEEEIGMYRYVSVLDIERLKIVLLYTCGMRIRSETYRTTVHLTFIRLWLLICIRLCIRIKFILLENLGRVVFFSVFSKDNRSKFYVKKNTFYSLIFTIRANRLILKLKGNVRILSKAPRRIFNTNCYASDKHLKI